MKVFKELLRQLIFLFVGFFVFRYELMLAAPSTPELLIKNGFVYSVIYMFVISIPLAFDARERIRGLSRIVLSINFLPIIIFSFLMIFPGVFTNQFTGYEFLLFTINKLNYGCCID